MGETQGPGVQGLPGAQGKAVLDKLPILGVDGALTDFGTAIPLVIEKGMADRGHVHADLVGTAGFQAAFHHGNETVALQHLPVRNGPFAFLRIVIDLEAQAVVGIPADGPLDGAFVLGQVAPDHGRVDAVYGMDEELVGQVQLGRGILGHHQKPGGVFVNAVHQHAHPLVFGIGLLLEAQVEGQGVHQRAVVVAVSGVHHHAGRLVHHQHVIVFIYYIQGNVFREYLQAAALVRHNELDHVARTDHVVGLYGNVVHQHIAHLDGLLHPAPGGVLLVRGNELVYTHRLLPPVGDKTKMLKQNILLAFFFGGDCSRCSEGALCHSERSEESIGQEALWCPG